MKKIFGFLLVTFFMITPALFAAPIMTETYYDLTASLTIASTWSDIDLDGFTGEKGIETKNSVIQLYMSNVDTNADAIGARSNGSALNRYIVLSASSTAGDSYATTYSMCVNVDGARKFEYFTSDTSNTQMIITGVFDMTDAAYNETANTRNNVATGWEDEDLSGLGVGDGDICEVVLQNVSSSNGRLAGVRQNGSSTNRYIDLMFGSAAGWKTFTMNAIADSDGIIEQYEENTTDVSFFFVGYWDASSGFPGGATYTEDFTGLTAPSSDMTWEDLVFTDLAAESTLEVSYYQRYNGSANQHGYRVNGSSESRIFTTDVGNGNLNTEVSGVSYYTNLDSSKTLETYHEDVSDAFYNFRLLGYWEPPPSNDNITGFAFGGFD